MAPSRKPRCNFKDCKELAQRIVGDCGFCNGHFCGKHRMLESHACSGLEDCKKESHERNAERLNAERTTVIKSVSGGSRGSGKILFDSLECFAEDVRPENPTLPIPFPSSRSI
ncbi:AN1 zinc finger protein [Histoplasma capsulatum H143]|uniref:AN1 zinc finger protein n=1 Tax=Ajellomyces capsulatus (strain H143) TaxID=544712 RepID=C6H5Z6_AJECH|nr:AN1 zinc finger protein [Histoplasma capsulatum H143]